MCEDLACSLYVRGLTTPALGRQHRDDFVLEDRVAFIQDRMSAFVAALRR